MGFYYWSAFNWIPLGIAYGLLLLAFWGIARYMRGAKWSSSWLVGIGLLFLVLPISEELWIAWNFGQACKDAGTFVYKKVQVEGFYDDTRTTHAGVPSPQAIKSFDDSGYRFLEMRGLEKFVRLEKTDGHWRAVVLERPTARYWYTHPHNRTPIGFKVDKIERVVSDSFSGEILARETRFAREAPWYFVHVSAPTMLCPVPGQGPLAKYGSIYNLALTPLKD